MLAWPLALAQLTLGAGIVAGPELTDNAPSHWP